MPLCRLVYRVKQGLFPCLKTYANLLEAYIYVSPLADTSTLGIVASLESFMRTGNWQSRYHKTAVK